MSSSPWKESELRSSNMGDSRRFQDEQTSAQAMRQAIDRALAGALTDALEQAIEGALTRAIADTLDGALTGASSGAIRAATTAEMSAAFEVLAGAGHDPKSSMDFGHIPLSRARRPRRQEAGALRSLHSMPSFANSARIGP